MTLSTDTSTQNQQIYETPAAVQGFDQPELQLPETTILELLRPQLGTWRMLDIGVGTGRTTRFFQPLVADYTATDYSQGMIDECRQRFADLPAETFILSDASNMHELPSASFDFLLFSYNGIDSLTPDKRQAVFREVRRLGTPGATFVFSTHNLQGIAKMFEFHPHRKPQRLWENLRRSTLTRLANKSYRWLQQQEWAIIKEASLFIPLVHYYIKPASQVRLLEAEGFTDVRVFDLTGAELTPPQWPEARDSWLYYLCQLPQ